MLLDTRMLVQVHFPPLWLSRFPVRHMVSQARFSIQNSASSFILFLSRWSTPLSDDILSVIIFTMSSYTDGLPWSTESGGAKVRKGEGGGEGFAVGMPEVKARSLCLATDSP